MNQGFALAEDPLPDIETFFAQFNEEFNTTDYEIFQTSLAKDEAYNLFSYDLALKALYERTLATLAQYDPAQLTPDQRFSYNILQNYLHTALELDKYEDQYTYPLTRFNLTYSLPLDAYLYEIVIEDKESAELYVKGLLQFNDLFDQYMNWLIAYEQRGVIPPPSMLDQCYTEIQRLIDEDLTENPETNLLYVNFYDCVSELSDLTDEEKAALCAKALENIGTSPVDQYRKLLAYVGELQAKAAARENIWQLPGGSEYYEFMLKYQTTTSLTPDEVHEQGLQEVARLQAEIRQLLDELGYAGVEFAKAIQSVEEAL